ncbi:pyroglutamyl-peptidase [Dokdonella fugitiva]|uniref:Pyrrolidone-carboxylate peptidase n=1 Tax=Dokdonella fugitiva TaxID=328517 RepID=A0A839F4V3_9GAMM|nr:pyroglutamyl-peptidase I [Dokdonella fugitiva]MBA8889082.1 pyroglutamyl-peptidase [Dokdonella fugitiva]
MPEPRPGVPRVLLTGFEPFGGEVVNPSQDIVRALDGATIAGHRVVGHVLPVSFAATLPLLDDLVERHRPVLVLALGQAGGRSEISLERVAVNLVDARIADNDGLQPIDVPVVADAPPAYFTSLPSKAIVAQLRERGIPAGPSLSAGSFVCNQAFFAIAHLLATRLPQARGGFVHVPWLPQQAAHRPGQPSMALATMIEGVRAAIECAIGVREDLGTSGGTTH